MSLLKDQKIFFLYKDENLANNIRRLSRIIGAIDEEDPKKATLHFIESKDLNITETFEKLKESWGFNGNQKDWYSIGYIFD